MLQSQFQIYKIFTYQEKIAKSTPQKTLTEIQLQKD